MSLGGYIARRLALLVLTLLAVPSLSFLMFASLDGEGEVLARLWEYVQATFLRVDLGAGGFQSATFRRSQDTLDFLADGFAADVWLLGGALVLGVLGGLAGGTVLARRPGTPGAWALNGLIAVFIASPVYWLGYVVLIALGPRTGAFVEVPFVSDVGDYVAPTEDPIGFLQAMWVPWLLAAAPLAAACARMGASQLREVGGEDFVRTARGKGVPERRVTTRHALPAAAAPVVGLVSVNMNLMITNVALLEAVFNVPGGFRYVERALANRDVDLAQGLVLEATFLIVVANFAADAIQAWLDPRTRK